MIRHRSPKTKVFIDALSLAQPRMSGIGHLVLEMTKALATDKQFTATHAIILVLPVGKRKSAKIHSTPNVAYRTLPLPARVIALLMRLRLMPPIDLMLGRGIYLFPNYRNWPVLFSHSITYCHDVSFILHPETVAPKNLRYLQTNIVGWLKRTDKIVTLTNAARNDICQLLAIPSQKIEVVPCGVDKGLFFRRPSTEIKSVKNKYGIEAEQYFIYVGNLEPRKNLERTLRAFSDLPENLQRSYPLLIIAAGGWSSQNLLEDLTILIKQKKAFHPQTYVPDNDIPALISGATALLMPSLYEGFGMPPLEAAACGTLPIVSKIPAHQEVFGGSLKDWYVDPLDEASIKTALRKATELDTAESKKIEAVLQKVVKGYNWESSASRLAEIIEDMEWKK